MDVRNHGLVFHDGRGLVGNVDPYEVIAFQTGGFERFVGLDGCTTRAAPGIPEVHEHYFAFVRGDEASNNRSLGTSGVVSTFDLASLRPVRLWPSFA